jgi:hypothetical protein
MIEEEYVMVTYDGEMIKAYIVDNIKAPSGDYTVFYTLDIGGRPVVRLAHRWSGLTSGERPGLLTKRGN